MERRNFIKTAILGAIASTVSIKGESIIASSKSKNTEKENDLVAVMGGDPILLYKTAIDAMGGMERFVKKGQKVTIKPNIGWDKAPEFAANTNPELVAEIVKDCFRVGASEVTVFDHTCDEWKGCYENSGIQKAARDAGAKVAFAHDEKYYREIDLPKAKRMKNPKIHEAILDCDVWINVPIMKNHSSAKMTLAMKNFMGIVWDRRYMHSHDLSQCIADCSTINKMPVLNIIDAYRIMTQNGPKGKTLEDVQLSQAIFMSTDIVALDTAAVKFFNNYREMQLDRVRHIQYAAEAGIGTMDIDSLKVKRIKL